MPRSQAERDAVLDTGRRRSPAARLSVATGWLILTPLAFSVAARVSHVDESSSLLLLGDGLTPFLGPPALVAFGVGLRQRRWLLTVLSAATAGVYLCSALSGLGVPVRVRPPRKALRRP